MMVSKVCQNCFTDFAVIERIIYLREMGRCDYCRSENVATVAPEELADLFELTKDTFIADANGELPHVLYSRVSYWVKNSMPKGIDYQTTLRTTRAHGKTLKMS
jgi:hypothetical protein